MIRDTPVCKAGFEGEDYNSAKAGRSCKIVKPGRSLCCAVFNLAKSTDTGREVVLLYFLELLSSCMVMFLQRLVVRDLYSTVLRSRHRKGRNTLVKVQLQCFAMPCCRVLRSRHRKREETRHKAITGFSCPQLQNAPLIMLQS